MNIIQLTPGQWYELPITKAGVIRHKSGKGRVIYCQFPSVPSTQIIDVSLFDESILGEKVRIDGVLDGHRVYALSINDSCKISVTKTQSSTAPDGAYSGERAINIQFYDESNKKLGSQWEASRRVVGVADGAKLYSIIKIGSTYQVDLKSRSLGATGSGVIGRIYELFPDDIESYGDKDPWYNMRFDLANPALYQPETELYLASNIVFSGGQTASDFATIARKRGADLYEETTDQNQGTGFTIKLVGSNRIFYQDKIALLEIESLDAAQNISARLEIFEGYLDLPI